MECKIALAISVAILSFVAIRLLCRTYTVVPALDTRKYWGPGDGSVEDDNIEIRPFKINYGEEVINDLKQILDRPLRLQEPLEGVGFQYGFNSRKMRPLVDYWRNIYLPKWKSRQDYLNQFRQFVTQVNGLDIHFIHVRPKEIAPADGYVTIPLLLLHGWPGSVREFYDIIPALTNYSESNKFVFEVVAPSLVGYGFSSPAAKKGFAVHEMAIVMRNLMLRLGYDKFVVQGGDWGSIIGSQMTTLFPENVMGYHSNMCLLRTPLSVTKSLIASIYPTLFVKEEHVDFHFPLLEKLFFLVEESGYFHIQATKPDTIGIALSTSPIGLAAYILEKFSTGTDHNNRLLEDGGLDKNNIDIDALLDNVMIYYLTNSITTSMRFYAESMTGEQIKIAFDRIPTDVPTGCARFKNDLPPAFDWQLKDKFRRLIHSTYHQHGGHFAALQVPEALYKDFIEFVKKLAKEYE